MFDSLKAWLHSIGEEGRLFRDHDDEVLHSALASLLYHFIALDGRHSGIEKHEFQRLLGHEFGLSPAQTEHLYEAAKATSTDPRADLAIVNAHLKRYPVTRAVFILKLLQLIDAHGVQSDELMLFFETVREVFPEARASGPKIEY
jgi:uncharacterized tellurite resistance protein B-like protein